MAKQAIAKNMVIMKMLLTVIASLICICILLSALYFGFKYSMGNQSLTKTEIENLISNNLDIDSPAPTIVSFLDSQGWHYSFDRRLNRYQVSVDKERPIFAWAGQNFVFLYVDESGQFKKFEVLVLYTWL